MKKLIVFLDVDGVLNCASTKQRHGGFIGMEPAKIRLLERIVKKTGAKVVLSSTWRLSKTWRKDIKECGLLVPIIDRTPKLGTIRGKEIEAWLKENPGVDKYAIIDDDSDMLPKQKLFQTQFKTGLTRQIAERVIAYLTEGSIA